MNKFKRIICIVNQSKCVIILRKYQYFDLQSPFYCINYLKLVFQWTVDSAAPSTVILLSLIAISDKICRLKLSLVGQRWFESISWFDTNIFSSEIIISLFNIFINYHSRLNKSLMYIFWCFSTCFEENKIVLISKFLSFCCTYFPVHF